MADVHTRVTHESWGSRIKESIKGIVFGLVLAVASFVLLFWNEGRAVETQKTLEEGAGQVAAVDHARVESANDGRLIHLAGPVSTPETLTDPELGIEVQAIRLERRVEMYQWQEEKKSEKRKKTGGGTETVTTYRYHKDWASRAIDSSTFDDPGGHQNPGAFPFESREVTASSVSLGAFQLSPGLIAKMSRSETLEVGSADVLPLNLRQQARIHGGAIYLGDDPSSPVVGDVRISFQVVRPTDVSVVARQNGGRLEPYKAEAGGTIELLTYGLVTADAMFESAQAANTMMTWVLRVVGFLMMFTGFALVLRPFSVAADVLPFLGNLVQAGAGFVAFVFAAVFSLGTISVAWVFYRPWVGVPILVLAVVVLVFGVRFLLGRAKAKGPAVPPPPPPTPVPPPPPPA